MSTKIFSVPLTVVLSLMVLSSCASDTVIPISPISASISTTTQATETPKDATQEVERVVTAKEVTTSVPQSISTTIASSDSNSETYIKTTSYLTDHRKHTISTKYTLVIGEDGIIESIDASLVSGSHESARYHARFNSAAKSQIVGQKISELSLSAVGGASDTTEAFLDIVSAL